MLHRLFEGEGTTVCQLICDLRLQECCVDLATAAAGTADLEGRPPLGIQRLRPPGTVSSAPPLASPRRTGSDASTPGAGMWSSRGRTPTDHKRRCARVLDRELALEDRTAAWQEALSRVLVEVEVSPVPGTDPWTGTWRAERFGALQIATEETGAPVTIVRTSAAVAADSRSHVLLRQQLHGSVLLLQDGRATRLDPGGLAFHDASRPFKLVITSDQRARIDAAAGAAPAGGSAAAPPHRDGPGRRRGRPGRPVAAAAVRSGRGVPRRRAGPA